MKEKSYINETTLIKYAFFFLSFLFFSIPPAPPPSPKFFQINLLHIHKKFSLSCFHLLNFSQFTCYNHSTKYCKFSKGFTSLPPIETNEGLTVPPQTPNCILFPKSCKTQKFFHAWLTP